MSTKRKTYYTFVCYSCRKRWERQKPTSDCPRCGTTNDFINEDH